jgi:hypothetical protein
MKPGAEFIRAFYSGSASVACNEGEAAPLDFSIERRRTNGVALTPCARENKIEQSQLSGDGNELLADSAAPSLASRTNPSLETVGALDRTEDGGRQGALSDARL